MRHPEKGMAVRQDSRFETSGEGGTSTGIGFPGVRHSDGMAALKDSGCDTRMENGGAEGFRV